MQDKTRTEVKEKNPPREKQKLICNTLFTQWKTQNAV